MGALVQTMFAISAADARLAHPGMEALHRLEVFAVDVGFAEVDFAHTVHRLAQVAGLERLGQTVLAVVGQADSLVEVVDDLNRQHRPENFDQQVRWATRSLPTF